MGRSPQAMSSIAITGANGFVGSTVLAHLQREGLPVVGLVRRKLDGLREVASWTQRDLEASLAGVTSIVHAASVVHRPGASAHEYEDFNTRGTETLVQAARAVGVKNIVFLSSIKVYGEEPPGSIDESTPIDLSSPYASSKAAAENVLLDAAAAGGPIATILRLCPVYGPGDKGNVRRVAVSIARRRFALPGDGSTRKSLVHVSVVAKSVASVLARPVTGVFVLADPVAPTMRELADTIAAALHRRRPFAVPIVALLAAASLVELLAKVRRRQPNVSRDLIHKSLRPTVCSPAKFEREYAMSCHVELRDAIAEEIAWLARENLV